MSSIACPHTEPPTTTDPGKVAPRDARRGRDPVERFETLCTDAFARHGDALARLCWLVSRLLTPRLERRTATERQAICADVVERVVEQLCHRAPSGPRALLALIERESAACTGGDSGLADPWLDRLAALLPRLAPRERRVLIGLYVERRSRSTLARALDLAPDDVDRAHRRGLDALRRALRLG